MNLIEGLRAKCGAISLARWVARLCNVLLAPGCNVCGGALTDCVNERLCLMCQKQLQPPHAFTCPICRGRIPMLGLVLPPKRSLCHRYADYVLLAFGRYEQPVLRTLVQQIKFKRYQGLATVAGNLMGEQLSEFAGAFDVVVPIPLSAQRLRERGFNQAGVLAERLSVFLAATYRPACIVRTRNTVAQTTLRSYADRAKNLTGCFEVAEPATIVGKSVLLVDDVWTSGATMGTAAEVLVRAGARRVVGVVIARV